MSKKVFTLSAPLLKVEKASQSDDSTDKPSIFIEGYANTINKDRVGDVIVAEAWTKGALTNYLKNPIILGFHDHSNPIGVAEQVSVDPNGLKVRARISPAAEDEYNLIADGVLKAFSVGFTIKDAEYDSETDIFLIKDVELYEISVVSVPANQDCIFEMAKSFENSAEYQDFKKSFSKKSVEPSTQQVSKEKKLMDPKDLEQLMKQTAESTAKAVADAIAQKAAEEKAAADAKAAEEAQKQELIKLGQSGAEKIVAEAEKRIAEANGEAVGKLLGDLKSEMQAQIDEVKKAAQSKMNFNDKGGNTNEPSMAEKTSAVLMAKALGVPITETKFGKELIEKAGPHVASAYWEDQVSTNMQEEIRRLLVVAPLFNTMQMPSSILRLPVNPEAGYGTWVAASSFGTTSSSGAAGTHVLKELTLTAYKLATKEFLTYEEEDDTFLAIMPIVRNALVRRMAKSTDLALLRGAGSGGDPLKGLGAWAAASDGVTVTNTAKATVANLASVRRKLNVWGMNPSDLVFIVSTDVYFDLLEDADFRTWDKVGDKATILNGAIGQVSGTNVIVSGEFAARAAAAVGAICVNARNFIFGRYKNLRLESDTFVESQNKILVATERMAFQQLSTVDGNAVSKLVWS
jgi:HK97 family phage prohead protease/HK97 family phage major capsid protein